MVVFARHNIISDPPFSKINLVVCRNLLIYFNSEIQGKILNLFQYSLYNGGFLFLGSSESITNAKDLEVVDAKNKIYKYIGNSISQIPSQILLPRYDREKKQALTEKLQSISKVSSQKIFESVYETAINLFAPPGFIINSEDTVIHFFSGIQQFLSLPSGKPTYKIFEILDSQLSTIVSNLIYKIRKEKKDASLKKIHFKLPDKKIIIDIVGRYLPNTKNTTDYIIITIEDFKSVANDSIEQISESFDYNQQLEERVKILEKELQYKDESLQTTIEELETSNEELQSTNEELVSSNEELQSTNEELQSVNEELYTVNSQYQQKIDELTEVSNDINNLLKSTKFGYLFLDNKLQIRKFTPEITKIFNIMEMDIGRPFAHISNQINYQSLLADMEEVLDSIIEKEIEVKDKIGNSYLLKMHPYRFQDNSIHGVVLTQIDITNQKNTQLQNLKLVEAVENSVNGILITNLDGRIEYVNSRFTEMTGYSEEEVVGKNPKILKSGYHSKDFYTNLWNTILSGKVWTSEMKNRKKNGEIYWEENTISPIKDKNGKIINFLSIKHDISESKRIDTELKVSSNTLNRIQRLSMTGNWTFHFVDNSLNWSEELYRIFGFEPFSFTPTFENFISIVDLSDRERVIREFENAKEHKTNYQLSYKIIQPAGEAKYIEEIVEFYSDGSGYLLGCIKDITQPHSLLQNEKKINEDLQNLSSEVKLENINLNYTNSFLIKSMPFPFVYGKIILDEKGNSVDYEFIEINEAFEKITGLARENVLNKNVKSIYPDIELNWIEKLGKVALSGDSLTFEEYSKITNSTFIAKAFSPKIGYFCSIFTEKEKSSNV